MDAAFVNRGLHDQTRDELWTSVDSILAHGPTRSDRGSSTGLALGYVQSGKTTAITALVAAAADSGYRVIIAFLGSTNLLLAQNESRLVDALGLEARKDYRWVPMTNPSGAAKAKEVGDWLRRGRTVLVLMLKHAGRIAALSTLLERAGVSGLPVLIIDDEADQASLNTDVTKGEASRTYEAIGRLRGATDRHLYVQFTATPYAPLLLEPDDHLRPDFVELLHPGPGYTGGREFFVDHAEIVVRPIPTLDEQRPKSLPTQLPKSLVQAFASFVAGTALLLAQDPLATPVSMLVHSTQRNDVQARYHFLLQRLIRRWSDASLAATTVASLPEVVLEERRRITSHGAPTLDDDLFLDGVRHVLSETTLWLVNSASDVNKIDWRVAPVHVLVGGNKLDRGFTVEGLTVTYMNRPPSDQVDTLEQRARAFGYRSDLLPYCQFFGTPRTLKILRDTVDTEYDLRAKLRDWLDAGHDVSSWAREVGLLLPEGTRPSRQSVLMALAAFNERPGWHQLRRPSRKPADRAANEKLVRALGLSTAAPRDYGRLSHPTLEAPLGIVLESLLYPWSGVGPGTSPGWRHEELLSLLSRLPDQGQIVSVLLLALPDGGPRTREWDSELGFINLFQGADPVQRSGTPWYPGDRAVGGVLNDVEKLVVQVHLVASRNSDAVPPLYTLAVHAGRRGILRKV